MLAFCRFLRFLTRLLLFSQRRTLLFSKPNSFLACVRGCLLTQSLLPFAAVDGILTPSIMRDITTRQLLAPDLQASLAAFPTTLSTAKTCTGTG